MIYIYAIIKYLTFPGSITRAGLEQSRCRKLSIPVEDANPLQFSDLCGHVEHELPASAKDAKKIILRPFIFNLVTGLFILGTAGVNIYLVGDFRVVNIFLFWFGISLWSNLFPSLEDSLNYRYLAKAENKPLGKLTAGFMHIGALLDSWSLTPLIALGFTYILALLVMLLSGALALPVSAA